MGPVLYQMVRNGRSFSGHERNCCFLNMGHGQFADVSSVSGFDFADDGRAVAQCDWDFDGDLDFWIANRSGPQVRFLRNDLQTPNHFVAIRLEGKTCNRDAIGARVEITLREPSADQLPPRNVASPRLSKTLRAGEGFLSQSSKWLHFGLGSQGAIKQVVVRWPGGQEEVFDDMQVDRHYHLIEHSGKALEWIPRRRTGQLVAEQRPQTKSTQSTRVVASARLALPPLDYELWNGQQRWVEQAAAGQPVLVNLWASWCRPCLQELKEFAVRESELRAAGVNVIALSVDRLDVEKGSATTSASDLLETIGYKGNAGWATSAMVNKIKLVEQHLFDLHQPMSVPTSLLIDSNSNLVVLYRGPVSVDQLLKDVAELSNLPISPTALPFEGRWHMRRRPPIPIDIAWRLVDHGYLDASIEYIARNKAQLKGSPHLASLLLQVGTGMLRRGDVESATSYYREAIKYDSNSFEAQNNLAWILATHPNASFRNGKEAIALITKAVNSRPTDAYSLLDTMAAAYAEDGKFDKAIATAQQAAESASKLGDLDFVKKIERRLQLYKAGQPYRGM